MKKSKKLLILLLSVAIICTALAVVISANTDTVEYVDENGQIQTTSDVHEAVANVKVGGTVTLKANIEIDESISISKLMTFDMAGWDIISTTAEPVFNVTAEVESDEYSVKILGSGDINAVGMLINVADPNPENDLTTHVTFDGTAAGHAYGITANVESGSIYSVDPLCSLYTNAVYVMSGKAADSSVILGQGAYLGIDNGLILINDADTSADGKYFADIEYSSILDIFDTTICTTANGIRVGNEVDFGITAKGVKFLCEGNNVSAQSFFTMKGITEAFEGKVAVSGSSRLSGTSSIIRATGYVFETDLTATIGQGFEIELTDTSAELVGDADEAVAMFSGAAKVLIGSGSTLYEGVGVTVDSAAKEANSVTMLAGARFGSSKPPVAIADGLTAIFDPIPNQDFPYVVGVSPTMNYRMYTFDVAESELGTTYDTTTGIIGFGHAVGFLLREGTAEDAYISHNLPQFVWSEADGEYVLAEGHRGTVCTQENYLNIATYTPPTDTEPGMVTIPMHYAYLDVSYFAKFNNADANGKYIVENGGVIKYAMDVIVDETAGAPKYSAAIVGEGTSTALLGVFTIEGKTITANKKNHTITGTTAHLEIVYAPADRLVQVYVDGQPLGDRLTVSAINLLRTTIRIQLQPGTYHEDASFGINNVFGAQYPEYFGGEFDPYDYIEPIGRQVDLYDMDYNFSAPYLVNGLGYSDFIEAYTAASKLGVAVMVNETMSGNIELPEISGMIVTNGLCADANFISEVSGITFNDGNGNLIYHYSNQIYGEPIEVNWYTGFDENPENDTDKWLTTVVRGGSCPAVPEGYAEGDLIEFGRNVYGIVGWSTEYITPMTFDSLEDYAAALDEIELISEFPVVSKEADNGNPRTYYAIYDVVYSNVLFKIEHADGAAASYFTSVEDWADISRRFVTNESKVGALVLDNITDMDTDGDVDKDDYALTEKIYSVKDRRDKDTIVLMADITVTSEFSSFIVGAMDITIDLNGKTLDLSARSDEIAFVVGHIEGGSGNGAQTDTISLEIKSSRAGGKIIDTKTASGEQVALFSILGSNKTVNVEAENISMTLNTLATVETYKTGHGKNTTLNVTGGKYEQIAQTAGFAFINYQANNYNTSKSQRSYTSDAEVTVNGATITSASENLIARLWTDAAGNVPNKPAACTGIYFNNCDITLTAENAGFVSAETFEHKVYLNGTKVFGADALAGATVGKIVVGAGTVFAESSVIINEYDEAKIDTKTTDINEAYPGVYYAEDVVETAIYAKEDGTVYYMLLASAEDVITASWTSADGNTVYFTGTFAKGAELDGFAPASPLEPINLKTMIVKASWTLSEGSTDSVLVFVPDYEIERKFIESEVSLTLDTQIAVNVYIHKDYYELLAAGSTEFVATDDENYYRATIAVDSNEMFTGAEVTLIFEEGGFVTEKTSVISVVAYAEMLLDDDEKTDAERDLAYYMLKYIQAAYNYMTVDDNENAVEEIAAIIEGYEPKTTLPEKTVYETDASALAGKLEISVNLASTPEYVIHVLDSEIDVLIINGNEIEVVDGYVTFSYLRVFNFDAAFEIELPDGSAGTWCYQDYIDALGTTGAKLTALTSALYDYILAAKAYEPVA